MSIKFIKSTAGKFIDLYDQIWPNYKEYKNTKIYRDKLHIELVDIIFKNNFLIASLEFINYEKEYPILEANLILKEHIRIDKLNALKTTYHHFTLYFGNKKQIIYEDKNSRRRELQGIPH